MSSRESTPVLLDNYTLQGAYGYLEEGRQTGLYEECFSHLIESIVIYDKILVPDDVLSRNLACQYIANQFGGVIVGESMAQTPDIHHHVVDMKVVEQFDPLLEKVNLFRSFDVDEAYYIERIGLPFSSPPGYVGRYERPITFEERHTYYAWYCLKLAAALGLNYAPNPIRVNLFTIPEFSECKPFSDIQHDILKYFETIRAKRIESVNEVFPSLNKPIKLPLVYNFIRSKASESKGMIHETLKLRYSIEAAAFRTLCTELENAYQSGDAVTVDKIRGQIKELGERWSRSLAPEAARKNWKISMGGLGTDFTTPWIKLSAADNFPHFVFLHSLLSAPIMSK